LRLYQAFFARAAVEESYAYLGDSSVHDAVRAAWEGFLAGLVESLSERLDIYGRRQASASLEAVMAVLASPEAAAVAPGVVRAATGAALEALVAGIGEAGSMTAALDAYDRLPPGVRAADHRGALDRALIRAMTKAVGDLRAGFGDSEPVHRAGVRLGLGRGGYERATPVVRAGIVGFFDACAAFARQCVDQDAPEETSDAAAYLLGLLPLDWTVGIKSPSFERVAPARMVESLLVPILTPMAARIVSAPANSDALAGAVEEVAAMFVRHPLYLLSVGAIDLWSGLLVPAFVAAAKWAPAWDGEPSRRVLRAVAGALPGQTTAVVDGLERRLVDHLAHLCPGVAVEPLVLPGERGTGAPASSPPAPAGGTASDTPNTTDTSSPPPAPAGEAASDRPDTPDTPNTTDISISPAAPATGALSDSPAAPAAGTPSERRYAMDDINKSNFSANNASSGGDESEELAKVLASLASTPSDSQAEEDALDAAIAFAHSHTSFMAKLGSQTVYRMVLTSIFGLSLKRSGGDTSSRGWRMAGKIVPELPAGDEIEVLGVKRTPAHHMSEVQARGIAAFGLDPVLIEGINALMRPPAGSPAEVKALNDLLAYARRNPGKVSGGTGKSELETALKNIFRSSAAFYLKDAADHGQSLRMMQQIAEYLPKSTTVELGEDTATLTEHAKRVEGMANFKLATEAPIGSARERAAVEALARLLGEGFDFPIGSQRFAQGARTLLETVRKANTNSGAGSAQTIALIDAALASKSGGGGKGIFGRWRSKK
jgi:hypothetical protein